MFTWPNNATAAVSLAYDDALASQLDNAVPALNRYGFKATFYPTLASPTLHARLAAWRQLAQQGHELGNHTVYHPCRASLPGRAWVAPFHDLDKQSVAQIVQEVALANTFLHAIDGEHERTFNVPCGDSEAGGESYLEQVKPLFAGIKADFRQGRQSIPNSMEALDIHQSLVWSPADVNGAELIAHVKKSAELGSLASITFHGIGGDYLAVSREAHEELLAYLADNRQTYWVDAFLNISRHVTKQHAQHAQHAQEQRSGSGSPSR